LKRLNQGINFITFASRPSFFISPRNHPAVVSVHSAPLLMHQFYCLFSLQHCLFKFTHFISITL